MALNAEILARAATEARGLAMDAVQAANSGHLGLPLGDAEIGAVLFGHALRYFPDDPHWINRDRFVLSAGHGSMFLYGWLHLAGYAISLEDIRNFRQLHSKTPGHPEFGETSGVEATTGPLGQGVGNAVGMAVSAKMAEARFNTPNHTIFDHKVVCLAGDGCLQEGVAAEAAAFAGHFKLDNLILIYDSNLVTLDAMAALSQSENTALRFQAYGFDVHEVNGNNMEEFLAVFEKAKAAKTGRPQFIVAHTVIAKGIPEVAGTNKGHGEAGVKFVDAARKALGLPDEKFYVSKEVRAYFAEHRLELKKVYDAWQETFTAWRKANPESAKLLEHGMCAILNGFAYYGLFRPSGATFLVFADYCRPSIRLAALAKLPALYIFTHDSVGVGEDGPTHEPVETVSALRLVPNLDVFRPGVPEETAGAFVGSLEGTDRPTLRGISRKNFPTLFETPSEPLRYSTSNGFSSP